MSKELYEEVKEWVSGKPDGSEPYGKLGALPQYVRTKIKELCLFAESADKIIISNLTPPTEQEVCEALSEWGTKYCLDDWKDVTFLNNRFYISNWTLCERNDNGTITFNNSLPPHLITMIGRFYESQVEE